MHIRPKLLGLRTAIILFNKIVFKFSKLVLDFFDPGPRPLIQLYGDSNWHRDMVVTVTEFGRAGRAAGAGFYEYPAEKGTRKFLWPQLKPLFEQADVRWDIQDLKDRLLYRQAVETARCLSENVLTTVHDANIGSIFGIGFPAWTGGAMQFIYGLGIDAFVTRADQLAARYGVGFALSDEVKAAIRRFQPVY